MADDIEQRAFRYATANYLHVWLTFDRGIHASFSTTGPDEPALRKLLTRYNAMRTLWGVEKAGLDPFVKALRNGAASGTNDVVALVEEVNDKIFTIYKKRNCISAVSKALWMMRRHPVAIYDNLSREGLRKFGEEFEDGDYSAFLTAWFRYFDRQSTKDSIASACDWLMQSAFVANLESYGVARRDELKQWTSEAWFRNRVCDFRLMQAASDRIHLADVALYLGPR